MLGRHFRVLCIAGLLSVMFGARLASAAMPDAYDPWPGLVQDIFDNRPINDGAGVSPSRCRTAPRMRRSFR